MNEKDKKEFRKIAIQMRDGKFHNKYTAITELIRFIDHFDRGR